VPRSPELDPQPPSPSAITTSTGKIGFETRLTPGDYAPALSEMW
jgi:hypothetical protein